MTASTTTALLSSAIHNAPLFLTVLGFLVFIAAFLYAFLEKRPSKPFLNQTVQQIRLIDKVPLTHNTVRLRFELPNPYSSIGLPPGQHIRIFGPNREGERKGFWNDRIDPTKGTDLIQRSYTPVTGDEFRGFVDFVVKVYKRGVSDRFPDGGKLSQYLGALEVGDVIDVKGPSGQVTYHGHGKFTYGKQVYQRRTRIGMVAGGSGITPMLQIVRHLLTDRTSYRSEIWLLFANQSEEDILLQDTLDEMASHYPTQFHLWYTIDSITNRTLKWRYSVGLIDEEMLRKHLPLPANPHDDALEDSIVLLCGPRPMVQLSCTPNLERIGWNEKNIITF